MTETDFALLLKLREQYTDGKSSTCEAFADACYDAVLPMINELRQLRRGLMDELSARRKAEDQCARLQAYVDLVVSQKAVLDS